MSGGVTGPDTGSPLILHVILNYPQGNIVLHNIYHSKRNLDGNPDMKVP